MSKKIFNMKDLDRERERDQNLNRENMIDSILRQGLEDEKARIRARGQQEEALKQVYPDVSISDLAKRKEELYNIAFRHAQNTMETDHKIKWLALCNQILSGGNQEALEKQIKRLLK